ncbi:TniQ family protein [Thaumasiovibrio sp. DFM-14]|uniref:TniQ family protein n=1 Tax=Thaumasiovibrio sp. DFM-14 TaxID=3384792 RepID=UPI00399F3BB4
MLLKRPAPHNDESLESYLVRVSTLNGYQKPYQFLSSLQRFLTNLDSSKYVPFPDGLHQFNPCHAKVSSKSRIHLIHALSQLTFNEPVSLQKLLINRAEGKFSPNTSALIRHDEVLPRSLLRTQPLLCPACINEFGYARYQWHFKGYEVCHIHNQTLVSNCQDCGATFDYTQHCLTSTCPNCSSTLCPLPADTSSQSISSWLAGENIPPLPNVGKSYRWGLVHWWLHRNSTLSSVAFYDYWQEWPQSFHRELESDIEERFDLAPNESDQLTAKYVLGDYLFNSILLPSKDLQNNLLLKEIIAYLDEHLWEQNGKLANLKVSALDICLFLGTSREQVAALYEQGLLSPSELYKPSTPPKVTAPAFILGDLFCLWVSDFQTPVFNRSSYVSRW